MISALSRTTAALVLAALVVSGLLLGTLLEPLGDSGAGASATPLSVAPSSAHPSGAVSLPAADVPGDDFVALPRYPGSSRSAYEVAADASYELVAAEYLALATVEEVRTFYQGVIAQHGWERADITYADGEWAYVLIRGAEEALIEIELRAGLVEIDLQVSRPIGAPAPALTDGLPPTPAPPTPQPAAPAPPGPAEPVPAPPAGEGDGDDDDDGEDGSDSGGDDDGDD